MPSFPVHLLLAPRHIARALLALLLTLGTACDGARPDPAWPVGLELDTTSPPDVSGLTQEVIDLGRRLFHDARFSSDRTVSCATCHRPEFAFASNEAVSPGVAGARGAHNAPAIVNRLLGGAQFWDGRAESLEEQVLGPLFSPLEMDLDEATLLERLTEDGYPEAFGAAFDAAPSLELFQRSIAAFERTLVSGGSPFDRFEWQGDVDAISESAKRGLDIFRNQGRCTLCHTGTNFSDELYHNIGLDPAETQREGRAAVTGLEEDRGAHKTPTLRNLALTAPYMHDGRFETLEEVVEHYVRGGEPGQGELVELSLSDEDVQDLVAFLRTLNGPVISLSAQRLRTKLAETP